MHINLSGKVAIVTGGCSGIGAASAHRLQQAGAQVIVADINKSKGQECEQNKNMRFVPMNVADEHSWVDLMGICIKDFGRLDILVNNAGIFGSTQEFGPQDPENISIQDWNHVHDINLTGVMLGCKYAIQTMKRSSTTKKQPGGSIINMSSRSGLVGIPYGCAYASSKAAIKNHTKSVALYCASKGYDIRCNSIMPAAIYTPLWEDLFKDNLSEGIKNLSAGIPLGRMGEPDDVAWAVVYFASDLSKFITGTELNIDGGIMAGSTSSPQKKPSE